MTDRLTRAIDLATKAHAGQVDKQGKPYIDHPIAVAGNVVDMIADIKSWPSYWDFTREDLIIAAYLHDTVEDTPVTLDKIEAEFGKAVRTIVEGVTRRKNQETYKEFIKRAKLHPGAKIVKLADLKHNLSRIDGLPIEEQDIRKRYDKAVIELTREELPPPTYQLRVIKQGCEVLEVRLIKNAPDGTFQTADLDFGGNATSAVYYGATLVIEALNKFSI